jgi:hypothetical protein
MILQLGIYVVLALNELYLFFSTYTKNKVLHTFSLICVVICFSDLIFESRSIKYTAWSILLDFQIPALAGFFAR